ncbi:oxidoreductase NAD-binding domain protein [Teladorsagia circumcincta]|uniref:Oxidoreductase NAD-binding domain protein n=1 Tax=Teladorsagia circumcincta TaxID=45464 RepID=A0A2G9TYH0_TELCI|nr:oxidoreductase NAD-binding domain protein [Teladorsagia circumcincta]
MAIRPHRILRTINTAVWTKLKRMAHFRNPEVDGRSVSRPYTPTKVTKAYFEVPIKIVPDGRLSQYIRHWKIGDEIEWRGPYCGDIVWNINKLSHLLLIAGGVGIAPFVRLVNELLEDDDAETRVRLVYCVRSGSDILFKELLSQWAHHWNVKIVIFGAIVEKSSIHQLFDHVATRLNEEHFQEQLRALCGDNLDRTAVPLLLNM